MLNRLPGWPPTLADMLPELGNPKAAEIGRAFGVTEGTAKGWIKKNGAPRAVLLAMYWLTSHGQRNLNADLHNFAQMHVGMAQAQARQIKALEAQIDRLARLADFGSANDPAPCVASGIRSDRVIPLTPDPGLQPTMQSPSGERHRLS